ncbi:MAG: hypothetical protein DMG06_14385 [Acidobacteria bacterium]|nr:MAG: hypothetical protein DMG06_14385 [Acidobacteriota bacterium]
MGAYHYGPLDIGKMRTRSIRQRKSKVEVDDFAQVYEQGSGITGLLHSLPKILTGQEFRKVVEAILNARSKGKLVIWGLGAHVIKCGLSPILIDLMRRGFISALAMNGASAIHDFEIAMVGSTSEDVEKALPKGDFGTSEETGRWMNEAINQGVNTGMGVGESLGSYLQRYVDRFPFAIYSVLASAYSHIALGTDTIHNHPAADGSALGKGSLQDFRLLTSLVRDLHDGGVFLNCGSAVILPEVFLKTISMVRNLGNQLENFTTVNLDFQQHYRPTQNVVKRPTSRSGQGIALTGHHELMVPLLAASLVESGMEKNLSRDVKMP